MNAQEKAIYNAIDNIDSGIFTGDSMHDKKNRDRLRESMARWTRGLSQFEEIDDEKKIEAKHEAIGEMELEERSEFQLLTREQIKKFPVQHISVSSIRSYLTDRQSFFKRYVRMEFEMSKGPSLIEGSLFHSVLELYWQELKEGRHEAFVVDHAFGSRLQQFEIDKQFDNVNWGVTGSKEKSIETTKKALGFYFAEMPKYTPEQVIGIEARFLSDFEDLENNPMPIPLKGFLDLIVKEGEDIILRDHKLVSTIVQQEEVSPTYEIQACEYWFLIRKHFGVNPKRMIFDQLKKSKNKDGGPQLVPYVVEYNAEMLERFLEIYRRIVKELSGHPLVNEAEGTIKFLPNPYAAFGAEESWLDFCAEVRSGNPWTLDQIRAIKPNKYEEEVDALDL